MLKLGLGLQQLNIRRASIPNGLFDTLGINSNCVLGLAMERLTNTYSNIAFRLLRDSDNAENDFFFEADNSFDFAAVDIWRGGSTAYIKRQGNQYKENNYAYQNTKANMPILDTINKRIVFDGVNDYMIIDDYVDIQLINQPISSYCNWSRNTVSGYVFAKNIDSAANVQYGIHYNSGQVYLYLEGGIRANCANAINNTSMFYWESNNAFIRNNANTANNAYSATLTNRPQFFIGCRGNVGYLMNGSIKTIVIFNTNQYSHYNDFVSAGI